MTTFSTKDDILTLLVHLGYLTYDKKNHAVSIPNLEIPQEFLNAVDEPGWEGVIPLSRILLYPDIQLYHRKQRVFRTLYKT